MEDVQAATAALQAENGAGFFGKDLVLQYARETSDRISKRDGTFVPKAKRKKIEHVADVADVAEAEDTTTSAVAPPPPPTVTSPPSHILLTQALPEDVTMEMLQMLFQQYSGFKEVRLPRPGLAFIEFESEPHATLGLEGLNGFKLTASDSLQLDYGKA